MKAYALFVFVVFILVGCQSGYRATQAPEASQDPINLYRSQTIQAFDRAELRRVIDELDRYYKDPRGLNDPDGLWKGGSGGPDLEAVAAWVFDVYLGSLASGFDKEQSWRNVIAAIQNTPEWRTKHPGETPLPLPYFRGIDMNRGQFYEALLELQRIYVSELYRPYGLWRDGAVDSEGIAAWVFDVYLNERLKGNDHETAILWFVYFIQHSEEWARMNPGRTPIERPETYNGKKPLPYLLSVVQEVAAQTRLIEQSCVETGGNNEFLFEVLRRLRRIDKRFGLNWKRAKVGDMSQDVVTYYWGPGQAYEGAYQIYVVDIINGHCGDRPVPVWGDVTAPGDARNALWTLAPCPSCL
ncbi:MAG TPA: hypothetical protein VFV50_17310 [Bdellovibrionales bacterium]|nr:hypothetical protein [Bdellovibrionales bacterium]